MTVRKAFLSHSSKDKWLVEPVFKQLRAAHAHFDESTFEHGESSASEIFAAISATDVFVLFLSKNSVESNWVKSEISLAQHRIFSGKIKKVLVFILDNVSPGLIPEWLRSYVYLKTSSPGSIASSIRSALLTLAVEQDASLAFFVGREKESEKLKDSISALEDPPSVLILAGNEGIGRRALAKRVLTDVMPNLVRIPIDISLKDQEGELEFYRMLLTKTESLTLLEFVNKVENFSQLDAQDRTEMLRAMIEILSSQRQMIFIRGRNSVIQDDGHLSTWLRSLVGVLSNSAWPVLTVISRRMISPPKRASYKNAAFLMVGSLDRGDSRRLLNLWLRHLKVLIDGALAEDIVAHVSGHPKNIQIAARVAAEFGPARLVTERKTFIDTISQHTKHLVEDVKLNPTRERLLALFVEFDYLSALDLLSAVPDLAESALNNEMGFLHDHGIVETDGPYLKLAPYLRDILDRFRWSDQCEEELSKSRGRLIEQISKVSDVDEINVSSIDSAVLSALVSGKSLSNPLMQKALLPSHLLRVAREFYNKKQFTRAIELTRRAYSSKGKLSVDAQLECLRLRGLAAIRAGQATEIETVQAELSLYGEQLAKRNAAFLKGFNFRYDGKMEDAEGEFRTAYSLGGDRNFHVLRELARLCVFREDLVQAEKFARAAAEIAHTPYILDTLLEILIEKHRDDSSVLDSNVEIVELFEELKVSGNGERTSFYQKRKAHYFEAMKDRGLALDWAEKAVEATPDHIPTRLILAKVKMESGDTRGAFEVLKVVESKFKIEGGNVDRRSRGEYDRLMVLTSIQAAQYDDARRNLARAISLPKSVRTKLEKKIDTAEAFAKRGTN